MAFNEAVADLPGQHADRTTRPLQLVERSAAQRDVDPPVVENVTAAVTAKNGRLDSEVPQGDAILRRVDAGVARVAVARIDEREQPGNRAECRHIEEVFLVDGNLS